jgi:hypothetical protein
MSIRSNIDIFDGKFDQDFEVGVKDSQPDTMRTRSSFKFGHIIFGAVQKSCSLKQVSAACGEVDPAFMWLPYKFGQFLRTRLSPQFSATDLDTILDPNAMVHIQIL